MISDSLSMNLLMVSSLIFTNVDYLLLLPLIVILIILIILKRRRRKKEEEVRMNPLDFLHG
jgi:hypothetical protein